MRKLLMLLVFILVLIAGLFAFTPLGFVLNQSGAGNMGIGWAKVDGTLMKGRISGFYAGTQPIGDVSLNLRPLSLLTLSPSYDVQWGGAGGQGTARLTLSRSALNADDIRMRLEIGALEGLEPAVRAMGGTLDIEEGAFRLDRSGCDTASGEISTNALSTLAAQYGRQFGEISGPIRCESGAFIIAMAGQSDSNDQVNIEARANMLGGGDFATRVLTQDPQIILALTQIGFVRENGEFVYRQSRTAGLTQ
nr:type II secretion system protein N [Hyphomonas sp. Mor2]